MCWKEKKIYHHQRSKWLLLLLLFSNTSVSNGATCNVNGVNGAGLCWLLHEVHLPGDRKPRQQSSFTGHCPRLSCCCPQWKAWLSQEKCLSWLRSVSLTGQTERWKPLQKVFVLFLYFCVEKSGCYTTKASGKMHFGFDSFTVTLLLQCSVIWWNIPWHCRVCNAWPVPLGCASMIYLKWYKQLTQ